MTVLHVIMNGHPLRISVDDGLILDVRPGKIHVWQRPNNWTPPRGERIPAQREGNVYRFPMMVVDPDAPTIA